MAKKKADLYKKLGVSSGATPEEIKKAYRKKAKQSHPDRNPGSDGKEFRQIQLAYDVLSDEARRHHYDETGETEGERVINQHTLFVSEVRDHLLSAIQTLHQNEDLDYYDLLKIVADQIKHEIIQLKEANDGIKEMRDVLAKTIKKITRKDGGENVLAHVLQDRLNKSHNAERFNSIEIAHKVDALEELKNYQYEFTERREKEVKTSGSSTVSQQLAYDVKVMNEFVAQFYNMGGK